MSDVTGRRYPLGAGIDVPLAYPQYQGHVYVLVFSNCTVKVGKTADIEKRTRQHAETAEPFGVSIKEIWVSDVHVNYPENERLLISRARVELASTSARGSSRGEYFSPLSEGDMSPYECLVAYAQDLTFEALDLEAATADSSRRLEEMKGVLLSNIDTVRVSRRYLEQAEEWMALVHGVTPDGQVREVPLIAPWTDEDRTVFAGRGRSDMLDSSYVDLLGEAASAITRRRVAEFALWAMSNGRRDLVERPGSPDQV